MKFCVMYTRYGYAFIEAETEAKAMDIANQLSSDMVNWSDDYEATSCVEHDSDYCSYITEDEME